MRTDLRHVPSTHDIARTKAFDIEDNVWQCALIQEADVMASALPEFGSFLTGLLAEEWKSLIGSLLDSSPRLRDVSGFLKRELYSHPRQVTRLVFQMR